MEFSQLARINEIITLSSGLDGPGLTLPWKGGEESRQVDPRSFPPSLVLSFPQHLESLFERSTMFSDGLRRTETV